MNRPRCTSLAVCVDFAGLVDVTGYVFVDMIFILCKKIEFILIIKELCFILDVFYMI